MQIRPIPEYLQVYIAKQDPALYTAMDHAGWRFIMKLSRAFFTQHAHLSYLEGLEKTGISLERIPLISEMDEKLQAFGWRAVPVCGFVPPAVFMEFLSLGILPIASDMRRLEHLAYTPAPDIVHEAAGHAPIIADAGYAKYLRQYGEISRKSIFSSQDWDVYVAIRNLSDTKENPASSAQAIEVAQRDLDRALAAVTYVSEATELARMSWWTIEYGLIGNATSPKIYGAGLLSSVGESYHCLSAKIQKIPLSLDCVKMGYDITRPQPQLYVADSFDHLTRVLEELADTMAFRRGGLESLLKAKKAATVTTTVLDSGLQISGRLVEVQVDAGDRVTRLRWDGPCQLSEEDREIRGRGPTELKNGFELVLDSKQKVVSVFGGAADRARYLDATGGFHQPPGQLKTNLTEANRGLNAFYQEVRQARESQKISETKLQDICEEVLVKFPDDWLLPFEILELMHKMDAPWVRGLQERLARVARQQDQTGELVRRGLATLSAI